MTTPSGPLASIRLSARRIEWVACIATIAVSAMVLIRAHSAGNLNTQNNNIPIQTRHSALGYGAALTLHLSQNAVPVDQEQRVFAEIRLSANQAYPEAERAPLSLALVIDTSGSMDGAKIKDAKEAVKRFIREMRDEDELSILRFSNEAEVVMPLTQVRQGRAEALQKVESLDTGGGTEIHKALEASIRTLQSVAQGRVKRLVLASDGLDSNQSRAEAFAKLAAEKGITVSTLGIGLDFDEHYLGALALTGHGNFGFAKEGADLGPFLSKELIEGAQTIIQGAKLNLTLPDSARFVNAVGADATVTNGSIVLSLGSVYANDKRRVVVELTTHLSEKQIANIQVGAEWTLVGGTREELKPVAAQLFATQDPNTLEVSKNAEVLAYATSSLAAQRQLEAIAAYNKGELARAQSIIDSNMMDLEQAKKGAPVEVINGLDSQLQTYGKTKRDFASVAPSSNHGKAAAKRAAEKDIANQTRTKGYLWHTK